MMVESAEKPNASDRGKVTSSNSSLQSGSAQLQNGTVDSQIFVIAGVDPGSIRMGVAAIAIRADQPEHVLGYSADSFAVQARLPIATRLARLANDFDQWINATSPNYLVLEKVFLGKNIQSAFTLGQSRGAVLAALGRRQLELEEVAVRSARKTVCGRGEADKTEIRRSLEVLLGKKGSLDGLPLDASDALALAYHGWRQYCLRLKFSSADQRKVVRGTEVTS